ncbi:30S ribosomal protein S3 [Candidatus Shikimatogenerans silvanidophilus]|uniref:30S ribosomal protein S3 n=1 Tax=Candidatus Shikimatogenerans silvanidophilus TaxID=2782547 RepID=UPI001BA4FFF4|nr:30S ribosomal protein S3 [Candidatus Shikimatogenerans silvanidophilus]
MGKKTNPISNRLGVIFEWQSIWYGDYAKRIAEDYKIRKYIYSIYFNYYVISRIYIERTLRFITIIITTSRPALLIGKKGDELEKLKNGIRKIIHKDIKDIKINIFEIKKPFIDSPLVAKNLVKQLKTKMSYKKSIKKALYYAMKYNVNGIKIQISGRLNGSEMSRTESYKEGSISLSTFRGNIDYYFTETTTNYGRVGIKVWIKKGEIYNKNKELITISKYDHFIKGKVKGKRKFIKYYNKNKYVKTKKN